MELGRLARVVRDKWVFVVVIGLLGAGLGWVFAILNNQGIEPLFEAEIALRIDPQQGETIADLGQELETAYEVALLAAADILTLQPESSIFLDSISARIKFVSEGRSQDEARERAQRLIQAYFNIDPTFGVAVDQLLGELETEAIELEALLAGIYDTLTSEDLELIVDRDFIDLQIGAVRQQLVSLTVADAAATEDELQANLEQRRQLDQILAELEAEKESLPPRPTADLTVTEELRARTIQTRLDTLGLEYERLFLRQLGITSPEHAEPPVFTELTPLPLNPLVYGALGLIVGVGIAVMGLTLITAARKPVWVPADVPIPVLGEIPSRRTIAASGPPWYDRDRGGPRKVAIQALRAAVEGSLPKVPVTLGIAGHQVSSAAVHSLAADLAGSFANAGWSVLLVDADFDEPSETAEYRVAGTDLASVLEMQQPAPLLEKEIARRLKEAIYVREDLAVVPAGQPPASPADAVAGRQFRAFVEEANSLFDLVIVVGSEITSPASQVQMQRMGTMLLALAPGRSSMPRVNALVQGLTGRRIDMQGAVFLMRSVLPVLQAPSLPPMSPVTRRSDAPAIDRLSAYPFPGAKATGVIKTTPLMDLASRLDEVSTADRISDSDQMDQLGSEILVALEEKGEGAYQPVSEYVLSRVEDILTAVPGQGNVSDAMLDVITTTGFIPLVPVPGYLTVGDRLKSELEGEVWSDAIGGKIEEILMAGSGNGAGDLDSWLQAHFFRSHVDRTRREPVVWHLTSEQGAIQVLVAAQRLSQERLDLLVTDVVPRAIDQMERDLMRARSRGDETTSVWIADRLEEARFFGVALGRLIGGTNEATRIGLRWRRKDQQHTAWTPVWSEGIRPNLAPVQRLGLLPFPVLTDEELAEHLSVG